MNEGLLSLRYARALLGYADSLGDADALYPLMLRYVAHESASAELRRALASPLVGKTDKRTLIVEIFEDKLPQSLSRMIDLVLDARRENYMGRIALSYIALYRQSRGIKVVRLTSARPMTAKTVDRIAQAVAERTHGKVETITRIDPSLQGGFVFQIDDLRLDASLRTQLERIRRGFEVDNRVIV